MKNRNGRGIIPLEVAIVLALVAVLLCVVLPSYQKSQTRSRVSSMKSKLRQVAMALEVYRNNNPGYPFTTYAPFLNEDGRPFTENEQWKLYPGTRLTTPVAYLPGDSALFDDFRLAQSYDSPLPYQIMYLPSDYYNSSVYSYPQNEASYRAQVARYGLFVLRSAGPDGYFENLPGIEGDYSQGGWNRSSYDPTNGTVSAGDIVRSQRAPNEEHI